MRYYSALLSAPMKEEESENVLKKISYELLVNAILS